MLRSFSFVARGLEYEMHVQRVLRDVMGVELVHQGGAGDGGIDLRGKWNEMEMIVQCKHSKRLASPQWIRELEGSVQSSAAQLGILVATEQETEACRQAIWQSKAAILFLQIPAELPLISRVFASHLVNLQFRLHRPLGAGPAFYKL